MDGLRESTENEWEGRQRGRGRGRERERGRMIDLFGKLHILRAHNCWKEMAEERLEKMTSRLRHSRKRGDYREGRAREGRKK